MKPNSATVDRQSLIAAAESVRLHAYAPYSNYKVGAALLDENGQIHSGCNVENAAYPQGACAEANAIGAMVSAGAKRIVAIAAVGGHAELEACTPCGGCRQRILEFSEKGTQVFLIGADGEIVDYLLDDLLPASFRPP